MSEEAHSILKDDESIDNESSEGIEKKSIKNEYED